jgi:hypothetical protein
MGTPHRLNVVGDFYVEAGCCTRCGVPWTLAPNLFQDHDDGCFVRKQPTTAEEFAKMLEVMRSQELYCVRYQGHDPATLKALRNSGQASNCDFPSEDRSTLVHRWWQGGRK